MSKKQPKQPSAVVNYGGYTVGNPFHVVLPMFPSLNHSHANNGRGGKVRLPVLQTAIDTSILVVKNEMQWANFDGFGSIPLGILIVVVFSSEDHGDPSNYGKYVQDALQYAGLTDNDKHFDDSRIVGVVKEGYDERILVDVWALSRCPVLEDFCR